MTLDRCVEIVREVHQLERACVAIARSGTDGVWLVVLTVLRDRVYWLRGGVSLEDPQVLRDAEAIVEAEQIAARELTPNVGPHSLRIH